MHDLVLPSSAGHHGHGDALAEKKVGDLGRLLIKPALIVSQVENQRGDALLSERPQGRADLLLGVGSEACEVEVPDSRVAAMAGGIALEHFEGAGERSEAGPLSQ